MTSPTPAAQSGPTVTAVGMQTNGVATNRAIDVAFSADMDSATINNQTFLLARTSDSAPVAGAVTYDAANRTALFKPGAELDPSTGYTATITTGVADSLGHHMAANYQFSFSTRATADQSPIAVYSTNPANGATDVSVNTHIQVVFTEGANPDSVTIATFTVRDAAGHSVAGAVTYDIYTNVATFYPSQPLAPGNIYNVTINGVADLAGVLMKAPYTFTFTTASPSSNGGGGSQPQDLVYMTNQLQDTVLGWIFDSASGKLTAASGSPANTDQGPYQLVVSPNGNFLYAIMAQQQPSVRGSVCTNAPTEVIAYSVDHSSGALSLVQRINLNGFCSGDAAAIDPAGRFLYVGETDQTVSTGMVEVLSLDSTTGKMSLVSGSPFTSTPSSQIPRQMVVAGNYLYAADNLYNTTTGILIYRRDPNTGTVQFQSGFTIAPQDFVAVLPSGNTLYSVDMNSGTISEFKVDATTGSLLPQGTVASGHDASEIEADPTGHYVAVPTSNGVYVYTVDTSGNLTPIAGSPFGTNAISAMFDTTGSYFTAIENSGAGDTVDVYSLSNGTAKLVTSTAVDNYPGRVTMLAK
ncbi:MAG TPA: Ig-like domain-containing protein [Acidobacteriaceae bacterium]|nr:Ig-like domain-containing protein [Acidobacteriaceae bacterium]